MCSLGFEPSASDAVARTLPSAPLMLAFSVSRKHILSIAIYLCNYQVVIEIHLFIKYNHNLSDVEKRIPHT